MNKKSAWSIIRQVRSDRPVIHNITNQVVMPYVANSLLAFGAAPIMAFAAEEMDDIVNISNALALNIGTLTPDVTASMRIARKRAQERGIPVVIDPVGAGSSAYRTETALALLQCAQNTVLRGNAGEILALSGASIEALGVESAFASNAAVDAARELAGRHQCVVCVSGEEDYVAGKDAVWAVRGGSPLMTRVTGMGCTATALIAACAAVVPAGNLVEATVAAMAAMSAAGTIAAGKACGPGSFAAAFLDALYNMDEKDFMDSAGFDRL